MNRYHINARMRAAFVLASLLVAAFATGGCVYRPNIQQGNLLEIAYITNGSIVVELLNDTATPRTLEVAAGAQSFSITLPATSFGTVFVPAP